MRESPTSTAIACTCMNVTARSNAATRRWSKKPRRRGCL
jgi:hypothetical protein